MRVNREMMRQCCNCVNENWYEPTHRKPPVGLAGVPRPCAHGAVGPAAQPLVVALHRGRRSPDDRFYSETTRSRGSPAGQGALLTLNGASYATGTG